MFHLSSVKIRNVAMISLFMPIFNVFCATKSLTADRTKGKNCFLILNIELKDFFMRLMSLKEVKKMNINPQRVSLIFNKYQKSDWLVPIDRGG